MEDLEKLREALKALVERSGRSIRELEREVGVGHGTLSKMLSGKTELRFRHLDRLGRALNVSLQELLAEAFAEPQPPSGPGHLRLRKLVAEVVRAELEAFWNRHYEGTQVVADGEHAKPL